MQRLRLFGMIAALAATLLVAAPAPSDAHISCDAKHGRREGMVVWENPSTGTDHRGHYAISTENSGCNQWRYVLHMWCDYVTASGTRVDSRCNYDADSVAPTLKVQSNTTVSYPWGTVNLNQPDAYDVVWAGTYHLNGASSADAPFPFISAVGRLQWRFLVVSPDYLTNRYCRQADWHSVWPAYGDTTLSSVGPCGTTV